jgi:spermidine/putrescine transport system permease protein
VAVDVPTRITSPPTRGRRSLRRAPGLTTAGLLAPPILWLVVFFAIPVVLVALLSVGGITLFPGDDVWTFSAWQSFLNLDSFYLDLFWRSVRMSLMVSIVCVLLAYPVAYFLALGTSRWKYTLLLVIIVPFFTSFLLRVAAWKFILGDQGVINSFAYWAGLRADGDPIPQLLYSQFTVMLVLGYVWIPFVALPIFVSLETLDRRLLEAASDLGATRWQAFRRITLPLSLPGVIAAFVFIFIPTIGEYVTPSLVGGNRGFMFGNAIADLFGPGFDWTTGAVLSLFLFVVVLLLTVLFARFLSIRRLSAS